MDNTATRSALYPFSDVYQVISFYNHNKIGQAKSVNLLEQETRSTADRVDLRWEMCCFAIERGLKASPMDKGTAFAWRYAKTWHDRMSVGEIIAEIAKLFKTCPRTIYRWVDDVVADIEREAQDMRLIPPETDD